MAPTSTLGAEDERRDTSAHFGPSGQYLTDAPSKVQCDVGAVLVAELLGREEPRIRALDAEDPGTGRRKPICRRSAAGPPV